MISQIIQYLYCEWCCSFTNSLAHEIFKPRGNADDNSMFRIKPLERANFVRGSSPSRLG